MKTKILLLAVLATILFSACSEEPKSVEYYKNNPEERKKKINECWKKLYDYMAKNPQAKDKDLEKVLGKDCMNADEAGKLWK
ncbi:hypothetical protein DMB95_03180 [Campylobacter sp. MIT 12-8780]|uniref:EexN family lipoprotein n=1 Tax=unclassified Campylobacter TaxID=2593542 RepID=UPI00115F1A81|nr:MULTISPECIES: EexN family lipoprotein [unclassified Campylobacter]NDJ26932.1 EexN family lipoprotein [Campylobacter sp. MIT 19-121]TQR41926.1 hypothetical protein DMB95_03180 [Campylobacter sp. MIT 12-8780]